MKKLHPRARLGTKGPRPSLTFKGIPPLPAYDADDEVTLMHQEYETEQPSSPEHRAEPEDDAASHPGEDPSAAADEGECEPEEPESEQQGPKKQPKRKAKHKARLDAAETREKRDKQGSQSTRKPSVSFPRDIEGEITAFLKKKPALYQTGFENYLTQKLEARRLEIWDELETRLRPLNAKCTAANFEKWYWSTRTMYGKSIRNPPKPRLPGRKETRQQYIYRTWEFHKPFIIPKSEKEEVEPSLIYGPGTITFKGRDMSWDRRECEGDDEDSYDELEEMPSQPKKKPRKQHIEDPEQYQKRNELAEDIAARVDFTMMCPKEKGRKMIMDGSFLEVIKRLPEATWQQFQSDYERMMCGYRERVMQHEQQLAQAREHGTAVLPKEGDMLPTIHQQAAQPLTCEDDNLAYPSLQGPLVPDVLPPHMASQQQTSRGPQQYYHAPSPRPGCSREENFQI